VSEFARRLDGVRIAYGYAPGERPILLVHGFGFTADATWRGTGWIHAIQNVGRGVITPDLRGHGQSDKPHRATDYAPRQLGADLVAVLDQVDIDQVDVVGYSMGSRVAAALTQLAPERVRKLVIGGAGPLELFSTWDMHAVRRFVADGTIPDDPTIPAILGRAINAGADRHALLACVEGVAGASLDVAPSIPVLYIAGGADSITAGVEDVARARNAAFLRIPGRTHANTLTAPEFTQAAREFLA
jgi:pimeloyl-ACP methyl ester carboxylesterase